MDTASKELEALGYQQVLERSLNVWQLTAFGLNYMIPLAPAIIFGLMAFLSGSTVALPYLLACIAMLFTANSYMVFVAHYPIAGSLYTYISRGLSPRIGFIAGWVLLLDYILIPTVTAISAIYYLQRFFPTLNFAVGLVVYATLTGIINILGVRLMARIGLWLLLVGELILIASFIVWGHYIVHQHHGVSSLFSLSAFHFTSIPTLLSATSLAVLSFLGFDAITTLSEESVAPKKNIPKAILFSVIIGGATMVLTGYLGVLASPHILQDIHNASWQQTALFYISKVAGGAVFAEIYTAGFILSMIVFNVVATAAGARLLFAMGRDGVLPKRIFSAIHPRYKTPYLNIMLIVLIECIIGLLSSLQMVSELVNFGALFGFSLLNITLLVMGIKHVKQHGAATPRAYYWRWILFPCMGAIVMLTILVSMNPLSLLVGASWLAIGSVYALLLPRDTLCKLRFS